MYKIQDDAITEILASNKQKQQSSINLIASENYPSESVREAVGSFLTYKYAEGYPGKRYYSGCEYADLIEQLAIERLKLLYDVEYANVQSHSGSQANQAVFLACLEPRDTILSLSLSHGGHLTHGHPISHTGKIYNIVNYYLDKNNKLDYEHILQLAVLHRPKLIIAGYSCFTERINWEKFRYIADRVNAYLLADIAHVSGLIAGQAYPSPVNYADIITSTTHKTLRGPRGAIIMSKYNTELSKKINSAVFPGIQGGPFVNVIAAKAIAFQEALQDNFKDYAIQCINNAKAMIATFKQRNIPLVFTDTETHIVLLSLNGHSLSGKQMEIALQDANILTNRNTIPDDKRSFLETSGIRLGSPASTTLGMKEDDFIFIANLIADIFDKPTKDNILGVKIKVTEFANRFPLNFS